MSLVTNKLSPADFKSQYWLKKELIAFCREKGINASGGKIEIAERILAFLQNRIEKYKGSLKQICKY